MLLHVQGGEVMSCIECCRCGKDIWECGSALHAIDPPGTKGRRFVCESCITDEELAKVPKFNRELYRMLNEKAVRA